MRSDDGRWPDELVHRVRRRKRGHRVRAQIEYREIRLVVLVHDRFHLGVDAGIPRQINREPIGELDDEAGRRPRSTPAPSAARLFRSASESRLSGRLFA